MTEDRPKENPFPLRGSVIDKMPGALVPGVLILYVRRAPVFGHAIPFIHFIVFCTPVSGAIDLLYLIS